MEYYILVAVGKRSSVEAIYLRSVETREEAERIKREGDLPDRYWRMHTILSAGEIFAQREPVDLYDLALDSCPEEWKNIL